MSESVASIDHVDGASEQEQCEQYSQHYAGYGASLRCSASASQRAVPLFTSTQAGTEHAVALGILACDRLVNVSGQFVSFSWLYGHPIVGGAEIDGDDLNESGVGPVHVGLHVSSILRLDDAIEEELHNIVEDKAWSRMY